MLILAGISFIVSCVVFLSYCNTCITSPDIMIGVKFKSAESSTSNLSVSVSPPFMSPQKIYFLSMVCAAPCDLSSAFCYPHRWLWFIYSHCCVVFPSVALLSLYTSTIDRNLWVVSSLGILQKDHIRFYLSLYLQSLPVGSEFIEALVLILYLLACYMACECFLKEWREGEGNVIRGDKELRVPGFCSDLVLTESVHNFLYVFLFKKL